MTRIYYDSESIKKNKDGSWSPDYKNANNIKIVCIRIENRKTTKTFDLTQKDSLKDINDQIERIVKQDFKNNKKTTLYAHYAEYDLSFLTSKNRENLNIWNWISHKPLIVEKRFKLHNEDIKIIQKKKIRCRKCGQPTNYKQKYEYYLEYECICGHIQHESKNVRIIDSMSFYPMSLKKIGEIFKQPKLKCKEKTWNIKEYYKYCERDVEILQTAINNLLKFLRTEFKYIPLNMITISKLSFNLLQRINEKNKIGKNSYYSYLWYKGRSKHQSKENNFIQKTIRAGRLERIKLEEGIYIGNKVDMNSMYSHICINEDFPDPKTETIIEQPEKEDLNKIGCSLVEIKAPNTNIGYLPINYKGKRIYPTNCTMKSVWTNKEILKAEKEGYKILNIEKTINYEKLPFNIFQEYFKKLYKIKNTNEGGMKSIAKLLMNSTTGKFAQKNTFYSDKKTVYLNELDYYLKKGYIILGNTENQCIIAKDYNKELNQYVAYPLIYSIITAGGRTLLYDSMKKIPFKDLLYVATDSIMFLHNKNFEHFNIGAEMGEWKIEAKGEEIEFFSNESFYRVRNEIKANGIKKMILDINTLRNREQIVRQRMYTMKQAIKNNEYEKVGLFKEEKISIIGTPRRKICYEDYIIDLPRKYYEETAKNYLYPKNI